MANDSIEAMRNSLARVDFAVTPEKPIVAQLFNKIPPTRQEAAWGLYSLTIGVHALGPQAQVVGTDENAEVVNFFHLSPTGLDRNKLRGVLTGDEKLLANEANSLTRRAVEAASMVDSILSKVPAPVLETMKGRLALLNPVIASSRAEKDYNLFEGAVIRAFASIATCMGEPGINILDFLRSLGAVKTVLPLVPPPPPWERFLELPHKTRSALVNVARRLARVALTPTTNKSRPDIANHPSVVRSLPGEDELRWPVLKNKQKPEDEFGEHFADLADN